MTVKELIQRLRTFDENHNVVIEAEARYVKYSPVIEDIQFKNGDCVIYSTFEE
jgi:hypothetical protein